MPFHEFSHGFIWAAGVVVPTEGKAREKHEKNTDFDVCFLLPQPEEIGEFCGHDEHRNSPKGRVAD